MNVKTTVFVIYIEAIIYLLLYNLHDCKFNQSTWMYQFYLIEASNFFSIQYFQNKWEELVFQRAKSVKKTNVQQVILNVSQQFKLSVKYVHGNMFVLVSSSLILNSFHTLFLCFSS